jgi:hypothetical protein
MLEATQSLKYYAAKGNATVPFSKYFTKKGYNHSYFGMLNDVYKKHYEVLAAQLGMGYFHTFTFERQLNPVLYLSMAHRLGFVPGPAQVSGEELPPDGWSAPYKNSQGKEMRGLLGYKEPVLLKSELKLQVAKNLVIGEKDI